MKSTFYKPLAALFVLSFSAFSVFGAPMQATVVSSKGKAEVQRAGQWVAVSTGTTLSKGDVIQTGFKSELILKIKNTTVTVAPLSRITIEQLAEKSDKDETKLFLDTGSLKSNVQKTADRRTGFTVRSPVATASVRGTVMEVKNVYNGTQVTGFEGSTATWKSDTIQTPEVEESEEETPAVTGSSANAVSDGQSGAGAVLVKKNQTSTYTQTSQMSPKENSARNSQNLGSAGGSETLLFHESSAKASLAVTVTIENDSTTTDGSN